MDLRGETRPSLGRTVSNHLEPSQPIPRLQPGLAYSAKPCSNRFETSPVCNTDDSDSEQQQHCQQQQRAERPDTPLESSVGGWLRLRGLDGWLWLTI
jgi:hypothetical protein